MIFTLESENAAAPSFETAQRLYADGQPTLIFVTDSEIAALERSGLTIDRAALRSLFSKSPNRLEMLRHVAL